MQNKGIYIIKHEEDSLVYRKHLNHVRCCSCYCYCWGKFEFSGWESRATHDPGLAHHSGFVSRDLWVITSAVNTQPGQAPRHADPEVGSSLHILLIQPFSPSWLVSNHVYLKPSCLLHASQLLPSVCPHYVLRRPSPSCVPPLRSTETFFIETLLPSPAYVSCFSH